MNLNGLTAVVVGNGSIGKSLVRHLKKKGVRVVGLVTSSQYQLEDGAFFRRSMKSFGEFLGGVRPDVVFIAISNHDDGQEERDLIMACVIKGIRVITCAKKAIANYWKDLAPYAHLIYSTASVGGGTGMIPWLCERDLSGPVLLEVILNGTLNLLFNLMGAGMTLEEAWAEAVRRKTAEPQRGSATVYDGFRGECLDPRVKVPVLFNRALAAPGIFLTEEKVSWTALTDAEIVELSRRAWEFRLVVSFSKFKPHNFDTFGPRLMAQVDDWFISGGFRRTEDLGEFLLPDVGNGIRLTRSGHEPELIEGEGAGPKPTIKSMMGDLECALLLKQ